MSGWLRGAKRTLAGLKPLRVPEAPARAFRDLWPGDAARGQRLLKGEFEVLGTTGLLLPAVGQGAVGIECRTADSEIHALLKPLDHQDTEVRVTAERALNKHLNGGCQVPIACYALREGEQLWLRGLVGDPDGGTLLTAEVRGPQRDATALGIQVAEELLDKGAGAILQKVYGEAGPQ